MRIRVISVNLRNESAVIEAFGERRTIELLPILDKPGTYQFFGLLYRLQPKDDHLKQLPSLFRQATAAEATTRLKVGNWFVPRLTLSDGSSPVPVKWLSVATKYDF